MKSDIETLCDKIDDELENSPHSSSLSALIYNLSPQAIKDFILQVSEFAEECFTDSDEYQYFVQAMSAILMTSQKSMLKNIVNELDENTINTLERMTEKRRKAIILTAFIRLRNDIIKRNNLKGKEFKPYNIGNELDTVCNIYVSKSKYDIPDSMWQSLDSLTTEPIFIIKQTTFGRTGKFKEVFDNIENILKDRKREKNGK